MSGGKKGAMGGYVRGYFIDIVENGAHGYRAELWWNPYDGWMVASTRWTTSSGQARKDATKYLRVPPRKMRGSR